MQKKISTELLDEEITLKDIINFFLDSWKVLGVFGCIGFLSGYYFTLTPNHYLAVAQIQMAQYISINQTGFVWNNVEDSSVLLARMRLPTFYSVDTVKACGLYQEKMLNDDLLGMLKSSIVKGATSIVELKIRSKSKIHAGLCAQAVFEDIRESQVKILELQMRESKILLKANQERLKEIQERISDHGSQSFPDLSIREELKILFEEILRQNKFIVLAELRPAKLSIPIYITEDSSGSINKLMHIIGLLVGLFFGILVSICRKYLVSGSQKK